MFCTCLGLHPGSNSHLLIYSAADAHGDAADEEVAAVPSLFLFPSYLFSPELQINSIRVSALFF